MLGMKALENQRECLVALEREMNAWKHLRVRGVLGTTRAERGESLRVRDLKI